MGPHHARRKLAGGIAVAALACWLPLAGVASATVPLPSPAGVLALAERGLRGDFEAPYKVSGQLAVFAGPGSSGTGIQVDDVPATRLYWPGMVQTGERPGLRLASRQQSTSRCPAVALMRSRLPYLVPARPMLPATDRSSTDRA
jgi:hypothetical protein